uniref:Uncharacterized protein n=1 Tax=Arundo donax TaxID=35708 RepID=A0A0A9FJ21_ARUDO
MRNVLTSQITEPMRTEARNLET